MRLLLFLSGLIIGLIWAYYIRERAYIHGFLAGNEAAQDAYLDGWLDGQEQLLDGTDKLSGRCERLSEWIAHYQKRVDRLEARWERAINLYPDLEHLELKED
jgi:hypothetical protein